MIFANENHSLNSYLSKVLNNLLKAYSQKMALLKQLKNCSFISGGPHKMLCIFKLAIVAALVPLLLQNCTTDKVPPVVFIESPQENATFTNTQSIPVLGTIEDNRDIESASITLYNPSNEAVKSVFFNDLSVSFYYIDYSLQLDSTLESGEYLLKVSATDGVSAASKSLPITIIGKTNQSNLNWLFAANEQATSVYYHVNGTQEQVLKTGYFNFNNQFTSSDLLTSVFINQANGNFISSTYNQLYEPTANPLIAPGVNEIQTVAVSNNYIAHIDFNGFIQLYTSYGSILSSGYVPNGYIAQASEICGNYLLVNAFSSESKLYVYYIPTGNLISAYTIDGRLINAFAQPNEHVQLFTYSNGDLNTSTLSINEGTFSDFKSFTCNAPSKIAKKNNEIFALIDGEVYSTEDLYSVAGFQLNTEFGGALNNFFYSNFFEYYIANTSDSMFVYSNNKQLINAFKLKEPNTIGLPITY